MTRHNAAQRKAQLNTAVKELQAAIDRLITPTPSYVRNTYIEVPGLYQQLAIGLDGYRHGAQTATARSRPPLWEEAQQLKASLDEVCDINWTGGGYGDTITNLLYLAQKKWATHDAHNVHKLAGVIHSWANDIEELFDRASEHTKYITGSCPQCGAETTHHRDTVGETVRSPAIKLNIETGATCQNCQQYWPPSKYVDLCKSLGYPLPAGVLE